MQLLTVQQAAEKLAVHEDTVRRLIERGELSCVRVGRAVRVDEAELELLVNRGKPRRAPQVRETIAPKQQGALHAKAGIIDGELKLKRGTAKARALAAASEHFGRQITSAAADNEDPGTLTYGEASWVLDWLQEEIDRLGVDR